jgi:hypothetical protein
VAEARGGAGGARRQWGRHRLTGRWFRAGGSGSEESRLGFPGAAAARSSGEVFGCRSFDTRRRTGGGRR